MATVSHVGAYEIQHQIGSGGMAPVFLATGFGVELSADERRANGVDAVLVKPLQIQDILDAVAEVARTRPPAGPPEDR